MLGQLIGPSAFIGSLIDEIWPAIMWQCPSSSSAHAADDLIELCDDTADDNVAPADAFIADAYAKVHILIGTIASRDLIVSFQSLARCSSSARRRPRSAAVSMPRNWMGNFREKLFQETSQRQRATDRIDPINSAQTTEIWWKDLIQKTIRAQQSGGP
jgi:hypothetical protein